MHKITDEPLIDTALYVMLLMRANPLLGQVGGGWILKILTFWATNGTRDNGSMPFHMAQKSIIFHRAQPSPTCPRNGFDLIKSITYGAE